jgi:hypothetical protein
MMDLILEQPLLICGLLFATLLLSLEIGRALGQRRFAAGGEAATGAIDGAIYALLGLMLAFTFTGAAQRFDQRRALMVDEANAIGTATLRLDMLPADAQPAMRAAFGRYIESRIHAYAEVGDAPRLRRALEASVAIQKEIWDLAIAAGRRPDAQAATNQVLLPALNDMIDITTTRSFTMLLHPPEVIYVLLVALALAASVLAGHGLGAMPGRPWLHMVCYAAVMTAAIYIIIDLEHPRLGLIRVDGFEQLLVRLSRGN